jgi:CspA family cold shock protein
MGRYKDYRERPSRSYDDERSSSDDPREHRSSPGPQSARSSPGPLFGGTTDADAVDAVVKWFNAEKGFGFVSVTNGKDAFLHIRQLEAAGHRSTSEGDRLKVSLGQGQKGPEVKAILDFAAAAQSPARPPHVSSDATAGCYTSEECLGTVRMYKQDKGFGFIGLDDGGKDAFVHATALEKSGLTVLKEGERVRLTIAQGQKGPEVRSIKLVD